MSRALTSKQQLFVQEYIVDRNAAAAARRSGYSEKTADRQGHRMLRNAEIRTAIEVRTDARAERLGLTADYVLEGIRRVIEQCEDAGSNRFDAKAALKGYELLGKHLKLFTEKTELSGSLHIQPMIVIDL